MMRKVQLALIACAAVATALPVYGAPMQAGERVLVDYYSAYAPPANSTDDLGRVWNVNQAATTNTVSSNLKNTSGAATDTVITWTDGMPGINSMGAGPSGGTLKKSIISDYPTWATSDSVWIGTATTPSADLSAQCVISGLDAAMTYSITFYGSRGILPTDNRHLDITIGSQTQTLIAAGPAGESMVTFTNLAPDQNGVITVNYATSATTGNLNVIDIQAVPEPATLSLLAAGALGGVLRRRQVSRK